MKLKQKTPIQNVQVDHFDRQFDTPVGGGAGTASDNFMDDEFDSMPSTNLTPTLQTSPQSNTPLLNKDDLVNNAGTSSSTASALLNTQGRSV